MASVVKEFLVNAAWPSALALVLLVLIIVLGTVIWSIRRHRDPKLEIRCDAPIEDILPSIAGLTSSAVHDGNSVELLVDGAFFDCLFLQIGRATRSVHFETFLWKDGQLGRRLADVLIERCHAGVVVRLLVDAAGGKDMGKRPKVGGKLLLRIEPNDGGMGSDFAAIYTQIEPNRLIGTSGRRRPYGPHGVCRN